MRGSREEWAKRVRRWQESELTAAEFAAEMGINAKTLSYWKWRLGKERETRGERSARSRRAAKQSRRPAKAAKFVEVTAPAGQWWRSAERIEVVLDDGVVIRVPDSFEAETLRRVLTAVGSRQGAA